MTNDEGELEQSNRVILNVPVKFYPLGLLINESLLIGVDTELITVNQNSTYSQIQKTVSFSTKQPHREQLRCYETDAWERRCSRYGHDVFLSLADPSDLD